MNKNIIKLTIVAFIFLLSACDDFYPRSDNTQVSGTSHKTFKLDNDSPPACTELTHKTPTKTCYLLWCQKYKKGGLLTSLYCEDNKE